MGNGRAEGRKGNSKTTRTRSRLHVWRRLEVPEGLALTNWDPECWIDGDGWSRNYPAPRRLRLLVR